MPKQTVKYDYNDVVRLQEIGKRIDDAMVAKYGRIISDNEFIKEMKQMFDVSKVPSSAVLCRFRTAKRRGEIPNPQAVYLTSMACTLDVSVDYLLGISGKDSTLKRKIVRSMLSLIKRCLS